MPLNLRFSDPHGSLVCTSREVSDFSLLRIVLTGLGRADWQRQLSFEPAFSVRRSEGGFEFIEGTRQQSDRPFALWRPWFRATGRC
jgi:hypothetical protein